MVCDGKTLLMPRRKTGGKQKRNRRMHIKKNWFQEKISVKKQFNRSPVCRNDRPVSATTNGEKFWSRILNMDGYVCCTRSRVCVRRRRVVRRRADRGRRRAAKKNRRQNATVFAAVDSKLIADYTI